VPEKSKPACEGMETVNITHGWVVLSKISKPGLPGNVGERKKMNAPESGWAIDILAGVFAKD